MDFLILSKRPRKPAERMQVHLFIDRDRFFMPAKRRLLHNQHTARHIAATQPNAFNIVIVRCRYARGTRAAFRFATGCSKRVGSNVSAIVVVTVSLCEEDRRSFRYHTRWAWASGSACAAAPSVASKIAVATVSLFSKRISRASNGLVR
ncbi:hypothetical protein BDZ88DRAFT_455157 [Geranomyces variabilis]|nr:hypothetical protein BDZ88DRAFT_455157 [Geranomyces variabilis]KAJ3140312.1 hypothetical protein HDU90_008540 [Geranomyces variabilis]